MKIAIIGGGPAGLYAAILLKKQRPEAEITVYERNRPDDTICLRDSPYQSLLLGAIARTLLRIFPRSPSDPLL